GDAGPDLPRDRAAVAEVVVAGRRVGVVHAPRAALGVGAGEDVATRVRRIALGLDRVDELVDLLGRGGAPLAALRVVGGADDELADARDEIADLADGDVGDL